jgi:hypothetical protein
LTPPSFIFEAGSWLRELLSLRTTIATGKSYHVKCHQVAQTNELSPGFGKEIEADGRNIAPFLMGRSHFTPGRTFALTEAGR